MREKNLWKNLRSNLTMIGDSLCTTNFLVKYEYIYLCDGFLKEIYLFSKLIYLFTLNFDIILSI